MTTAEQLLKDTLYEVEQAKIAIRRLSGQSLTDSRNTADTALVTEELSQWLCQDGDATLLPADQFYFLAGASDYVLSTPSWAPNIGFSAASVQQWDATDERQYVRFSSSGVTAVNATAGFKIVYPKGQAGANTAHYPRPQNAQSVWMKWRARFNQNVDYTDKGLGATSGSGSTMFTAGGHFIQVLRNGSSWELGTGDGSSASQSSGGTADGNLHDFAVRWKSGEVKLLVDNAVTITKTTNLPTQPLAMSARSDTSSFDIDLVDMFVYWETA